MAHSEFSASERRPKVLVVDDEVGLNHLLVELLEAEGYRVRSAYSGSEALRLIAHDAPDVVLVDLMLPDQNGLQMARTLKAEPRTAAIPLLIFSCTPEAVGRTDASLFTARVSKPFDLDMLLLTLRRALPAA